MKLFTAQLTCLVTVSLYVYLYLIFIWVSDSAAPLPCRAVRYIVLILHVLLSTVCVK